MSRFSSYRLASLFTIVSNALLVIGSFLPFFITTSGGHVLSADSWAGLMWSDIRNPFVNDTALIPTPDEQVEMISLNIFMLACTLMALISLVIPPLAALASLFSQRRLFPILSLIFASLGLLIFGLISLGTLSLNGFCPPGTTDPAQCGLVVNTPGPGFWLAGGGFMFTLTGFSVLIVLSRKKANERRRMPATKF